VLAEASRASADEVPPPDAANPSAEASSSPAAGAPNVVVFERDGKKVIVVVVGPDVVPPRVAPPVPRASVWPWVLVAGGAITTAAAGLLQVAAIDQKGQSTNYLLHAGRSDLTSAQSADFIAASSSHYDAARKDQAAAITFAIIGVAAVATGLTWAILRDRAPMTAKLTNAVLGLAPVTF
jgi:hypothetical protein